MTIRGSRSCRDSSRSTSSASRSDCPAHSGGAEYQLDGRRGVLLHLAVEVEHGLGLDVDAGAGQLGAQGGVESGEEEGADLLQRHRSATAPCVPQHLVELCVGSVGAGVVVVAELVRQPVQGRSPATAWLGLPRLTMSRSWVSIQRRAMSGESRKP